MSINVCWNPQNRACFSDMIDLRGHMPRFTLKKCCSIYLFGNLINVCRNPQNRACFSKIIDLRGDMNRFTLKMNVFPSISLKNPFNVCWNPQTGLVFPEWLNWGITCLDLPLKWMLFHLSPCKPHKYVLKPSKQACSSKMFDLSGHMPRFTLKMNVFPSMSFETP